MWSHNIRIFKINFRPRFPRLENLQSQDPLEASTVMESNNNKPLIRIIDDDAGVRSSWSFLLSGENYECVEFSDADTFFSANDFRRPGCILLDVRMPNMSGLELQNKLKEIGCDLPIVFVSGHADIDMAVNAVKNGAFDFLEKPVDAEALADAIEAASRVSVEASQGALPKQAVEQILAEMSPREHEITELLKEGLANHDIAERLDLSDRTVQGHRNNIYKKLRVHNLKQFLTVLEGG